MMIKTLSKSESANAMKEWIDNYPKLPEIDYDYEIIRKVLHDLYQQAKEEVKSAQKRHDYLLDVNFGMKLYIYFNSIPELSLRVMSNEGFWRYLSLKVVPDIVAERWEKDNEAHYYIRSTRIWLSTLWWYIHYSWQENEQHTLESLSSEIFSTDTIQNFVERAGKKGSYIEVNRLIIHYMSMLEDSEFSKKSTTNVDDVFRNIFRKIMKLNTAKLLVIEPALFENGEKGYVESLFKDIGITFKTTDK